ncbi:response regulator [Altericista sp. CCNU0014]|uniref:response regulator n=1 Tax=Altericista sp. CCNU0014 TaxID=3082949 RepID=UPI003850F5B4
MTSDLPTDDQATALFLMEAGELCQQFEEGLLLLTRETNPLDLQKIARIARAIYQGAGQVGLVDLQLLALGLGSLLEGYEEDPDRETVVSDLLHHFCDSLQWSSIVHRSTPDRVEGTNRREFVLNALVPKALEIVKLILAQPLQAKTQRQLLQQQIQWIQWWSNSLDLAELKTIAEATLSAIAAFPHAANAIATVALAGFQVANGATLQRLSASEPELAQSSKARSTEPQVTDFLERSSAAALDLSQHLAGLARHAIFCVATQSIAEIVLPQPDQRLHRDGQEYLRWQDRLLVLHRFVDLWPPRGTAVLGRENAPPEELILVLRHEPQPLALALEVERLIVEPELPLGQPDGFTFTPHRCRYGWTCLEGGAWIEVVDVNGLLQSRPLPDLPAIDFDRAVPLVAKYERRAVLSGSSVFAAPPAKTTPKTILVVDDSKTVREILSATLQEAGYRVMQAKDGQEAIAHLQQQPEIHLTISDLEMSNLNGFEFLRQRLQDERWSRIPVLILSSHTSDEYRQLARKLGAADYLTIPYDSSTLLETVKHLIQNI